MNPFKIRNIQESDLSQKEIRHIRAELNHNALQYNYRDGAYIHVVIDNVIYQVRFIKDEAILLNFPPAYGAKSLLFTDIITENPSEATRKLADIYDLSLPGYEKFFEAIINWESLDEADKASIFLNELVVNPLIIKLNTREKVSFADYSIKNVELLHDATKALIKWGKTGFSTVNTETLKRREDACLSCPYLSTPANLLQKIIPSKKISTNIGDRTGKKVCGLCGCNIRMKIRLTSEHCPDTDNDNPELTRWGEAYKYKDLVLV